MEYIKWKEEYSVGNKMIDLQHKELFAMTNNFYNSIRKGANKEGMLKIINDLNSYVLFHFAEEEAMMKASNYAGIEEHCKEHQKFIEKVSDIKQRFSEGRLVMSLEITSFIKEWISDHILNTDRLYIGKI